MYVVSSHIPYQFANREYEFRCKSERVKVKLEVKLQAKIHLPSMECSWFRPWKSAQGTPWTRMLSRTPDDVPSHLSSPYLHFLQNQVLEEGPWRPSHMWHQHASKRSVLTEQRLSLRMVLGSFPGRRSLLSSSLFFYRAFMSFWT